MAVLMYRDLIDVISSHHEYLQRFERDTPASMALAIKFCEPALYKAKYNRTERYDIATYSGKAIYMDVDEEGELLGFEIY